MWVTAIFKLWRCAFQDTVDESVHLDELLVLVPVFVNSKEII